MTATFEHFMSVCDAEGIELHEDIVNLAGNPQEARQMAFVEPSHLFVAIAAAARVLRKNPRDELATGPINPWYFDDLPPRVLATMLNDSIMPANVHHESRNFTTDTPLPALATCGEAEWHFSAVLVALRESRPAACQLFVDGDRPVLLRKSTQYGKPSTLTLENIAINGIRIKSGSLIRAEAVNDTFTPDREPAVTCYETEILPLSAITCVAPLRLATFSLPTDQRATYAPNELYKAFFDLEDIRTTTAQVVGGRAVAAAASR